MRTATADDFDAIGALLGRAFLSGFTEGEAIGERLTFEPDRDLLITDGDRIVANAGSFGRDLVVPGGVLPAAHVSNVSVLSTHRRRGLLTRLIHRQLTEVPEPLAVLWASEAAIYHRFGYGLSTQRAVIEAHRPGLRLLPRVPVGTGQLTEDRPADVRKDLVDLYERLLPTQVGWSGRSEAWWDRRLTDHPADRDGFTERFALRYHGPDGVDGYALWSSRPGGTATGMTGIVRVYELIAATVEAYTALWQFLISVDLSAQVWFRCAAVDEPIQHLVTEQRALGARLMDAMYLRVLDLPAALTGRRYAAPVDVVLDVTDTLLPRNAGRWRLRADGNAVTCNAVTCEPTADPADLALDIADLGAAYLGGTALSTLAVTGRVRELRGGALARTSLAFGWTRPPWAFEVF